MDANLHSCFTASERVSPGKRPPPACPLWSSRADVSTFVFIRQHCCKLVVHHGSWNAVILSQLHGLKQGGMWILGSLLPQDRKNKLRHCLHEWLFWGYSLEKEECRPEHLNIFLSVEKRLYSKKNNCIFPGNQGLLQLLNELEWIKAGVCNLKLLSHMRLLYPSIVALWLS